MVATPPPTTPALFTHPFELMGKRFVISIFPSGTGAHQALPGDWWELFHCETSDGPGFEIRSDSDSWGVGTWAQIAHALASTTAFPFRNEQAHKSEFVRGFSEECERTVLKHWTELSAGRRPTVLAALKPILVACAEAFGTYPELIRKRIKTPVANEARHAFCWVALNHTPISQSDVARFLDRDHGAVFNGLHRAKALMEVERDFADRVAMALRKLGILNSPKPQ